MIAAVRALVGAGQTSVGRTRWVGIDGRGAAGKSTLARQIRDALPQEVDVVSIDGFWGPSVREWDWERFIAQVRDPLLAGRPARYEPWDWQAGAPGPWQEIRPGRVVVVEGVSSTRSEAGVPWDLRIWVQAGYRTRLRRATERDGAAMLPTWLHDWMPSEERYVAREHPESRADLVVSGE